MLNFSYFIVNYIIQYIVFSCFVILQSHFLKIKRIINFSYTIIHGVQKLKIENNHFIIKIS